MHMTKPVWAGLGVLLMGFAPPLRAHGTTNEATADAVQPLSPQEIKTLTRKVYGLLDDILKEGERLRADLQTATKAESRLMATDHVSETEVMSAIEETGRIRTEIAKLRARGLLRLKENLTSEQIHKIEDLARRRAQQRKSEAPRVLRSHPRDAISQQRVSGQQGQRVAEGRLQPPGGSPVSSTAQPEDLRDEDDAKPETTAEKDLAGDGLFDLLVSPSD